VSQLLSKVTVTSCSFYITCSMYPHCCWIMHSSQQQHVISKMLRQFANSVTFHKVVYQHTWGVVGSLVMVLLQIFFWLW